VRRFRADSSTGGDSPSDASRGDASECSVVLRPVSGEAAAAIRAGRRPEDVVVEADYPTEFSAGVAESLGREGMLGPFFVHRAADDVVVGELGGAFVAPGTVEIGYAVVASCWGRGYATDAVRALVSHARERGDVERVVGHTPLERPASGRVLEKAGFARVGEVDDEHEGVRVRVHRWELAL
jgi:RimJ/RimL family protein N-acetyltransferase